MDSIQSRLTRVGGAIREMGSVHPLFSNWSQKNG